MTIDRGPLLWDTIGFSMQSEINQLHCLSLVQKQFHNNIVGTEVLFKTTLTGHCQWFFGPNVDLHHLSGHHNHG